MLKKIILIGVFALASTISFTAASRSAVAQTVTGSPDPWTGCVGVPDFCP